MPARPCGSRHRFVSRGVGGVTGAVVGATLFFTPFAADKTSLLAIDAAHAEDTVESPGVPAKSGGEAPKLRTTRLAAKDVKDVKAKDSKAKDGKAVAAAAARGACTAETEPPADIRQMSTPEKSKVSRSRRKAPVGRGGRPSPCRDY